MIIVLIVENTFSLLSVHYYLRGKSFDFPTSILQKSILYPVVQSSWPALPEFDNDRPYNITTPMRRALNSRVFKLFKNFFIFFIKPLPAFNYLALG